MQYLRRNLGLQLTVTCNCGDAKTRRIAVLAGHAWADVNSQGSALQPARGAVAVVAVKDLPKEGS